MPTPRGGEQGQALVEAALTMPLVIFLMLGTLQLFLGLQARQMAQYAAFWAAREGSVTQGKCAEMKRVTLKSLLPAFSIVRAPAEVEARAQAGIYRYAERGFSGDIFWLLRERPLQADVQRQLEETFDQGGEPMRLEVKLVFWFPMKVPFANWVMARMFRAAFGLQDFRKVNPLMPVQSDGRWLASGAQLSDRGVREAFEQRTRAGEYVLPISVASSMRMMTPPAPENFLTQDCP